MDYKRTWTDEYTVHSYESDKSTRATPIALMQFMQESAWNHAEHLDLGFSHLSPKGLAWVLSRLSLEITTLPTWHKKIAVKTWPSGRDRLFAHRDFRLSTTEGEELAIGSTSWIAIDVNRRRPQRTDAYFHIDPWDAERVFPQFSEKLPQVEHANNSSTRPVYYSHLDVNGHVNNVKYLEFVMDSLPLEFLTEFHISKLEMNFLAEAFCGDMIEIHTEQQNEYSYLHSLKRVKGGDELCRLRTQWKQ